MQILKPPKKLLKDMKWVQKWTKKNSVAKITTKVVHCFVRESKNPEPESDECSHEVFDYKIKVRLDATEIDYQFQKDALGIDKVNWKLYRFAIKLPFVDGTGMLSQVGYHPWDTTEVEIKEWIEDNFYWHIKKKVKKTIEAKS